MLDQGVQEGKGNEYEGEAETFAKEKECRIDTQPPAGKAANEPAT